MSNLRKQTISVVKKKKKFENKKNCLSIITRELLCPIRLSKLFPNDMIDKRKNGKFVDVMFQNVYNTEKVKYTT